MKRLALLALLILPLDIRAATTSVQIKAVSTISGVPVNSVVAAALPGDDGKTLIFDSGQVSGFRLGTPAGIGSVTDGDKGDITVSGGGTTWDVDVGAIVEGDVVNLTTDLAAKQPLDSDLTAIAALTTTAFGRGLLDDVDAAAVRASIGAGTSSVTLPIAESDVTNLTTDLAAKQPLDSDLTCIAGQTTAADKLSYWTGAATCALADFGSALRTFFTTPSSANWRSVLSDESGTGAAYFQGGDAGTPSAIVLTNGTGLPPAGATFSATSRLLGRVTAGSGTGEEVTPAQVRSTFMQVANNMKTSDQTAIGTTYTNISTLTFSVLASTNYDFKCVILVDTDATTTGIDVTVNGPASPTALAYWIRGWSAAATETFSYQTSYQVDTANLNSNGATVRPWIVEGVLMNGSNAGTLACQAKRENVGSGPNVRKASKIWGMVDN